MKPINVFVSSTTKDLWEYRNAAEGVIAAVAQEKAYLLQAKSMDNIGQDGERKTPIVESTGFVNGCDWMVLIVGWNAGYTQPNAKCPVTEWEYQHAWRCKEARDRKPDDPKLVGPRKVFVFLAGDPEDEPKDYRAPRDQTDLARWGRDMGDGIKAFRNTLRGRRFDLFTELENFKELLTKTLAKQIDRIIAAENALVVMENGMLPLLTTCFTDVKRLALHKKVHDALHKLRQEGVKKLRNVILQDWPREWPDAVDDELLILIDQCGTVLELIKGFRDKIEAWEESLGDHALKYARLLARIHDFELPRPARKVGRDNAVEGVNKFASYVQHAFTLCNHEMVEMARTLGADFKELRDVADRKLHEIDKAHAVRLHALLDRAAGQHDRLQRALKTHHDWQNLHDAFEDLEANTSVLDLLGGDAPSDDGIKAQRAREAVEEVGRFLHGQRLIAPAEELPLVAGSAPKLEAMLSGARETFEDEGGKLPANWNTECSKLQEALRRFGCRGSAHVNVQPCVNAEPHVKAEAYDAARNAFDQLFFLVDTATLATVQRSKDRVDAYEQGLMDIQSVMGSRPNEPGGRTR